MCLSLPGELAREAWNTEKLMRAYEAKKKFEMIGAMMFSSATHRTEITFYPPNHQRIIQTTVSRDHQQPTNEDEGETNEEGQDISTQRFVVLSIAFCKHTQARVDVVFTQSLVSKQRQSLTE